MIQIALTLPYLVVKITDRRHFQVPQKVGVDRIGLMQLGRRQTPGWASIESVEYAFSTVDPHVKIRNSGELALDGGMSHALALSASIIFAP